MKIDTTKINELCLPFMKRPKSVIGAKAVLLDEIRNRGGDVIEAGEIVEVWQSYRGYGIKAVIDGRTISITRVSHHDIRFLKV